MANRHPRSVRVNRSRSRSWEGTDNRKNETGDASFDGKFSVFGDTPIDTKKHEIVYAVAAEWRGRDLVEALPFFSKINLRRHVEELVRMGFPVTFARIEATPRP